MAIIPLSQRDKRWKDIKLGASDTTIGNFGCTITCLAMIIGTTPDVVNERMKQVGGFSQGNLVIWAKIEEAFKGITVRRVWTYDNADVKANVKHVLVEVDGVPIGGYRHWVVYVGSQKLYDPWDGQEDPTSDYPNPVSYCVIDGAWEKSEPITTDLQAELDKTRVQRDENHNDRMAFYEELGFTGVFNLTVGVEKIRQLRALEKSFVEKDEQLKDAQKQIDDLKSKLTEVTVSHNALEDSYAALHDSFVEDTATITDLTQKLKDLEAKITAPVVRGWKARLIAFLQSI